MYCCYANGECKRPASVCLFASHLFCYDPVEVASLRSYRALLGAGALAVACSYLASSFRMAILDLQKLDRESMQGMAEFSNEVKLSRSIKHPCIVRLLGYTTEGSTQCLVYELLTGGNLEERLRGKVGPNCLSNYLPTSPGYLSPHSRCFWAWALHVVLWQYMVASVQNHTWLACLRCPVACVRARCQLRCGLTPLCTCN
jgi:Protein tyrosine and serine/threonine kinase